MAIMPRTSQGHGWLRPAIGVVELSQNFIQNPVIQFGFYMTSLVLHIYRHGLREYF